MRLGGIENLLEYTYLKTEGVEYVVWNTAKIRKSTKFNSLL